MNNLTETLRQQRNFFETGKTKSTSFRIAQLKKLQDAVKRHENEILEALKLDLNKAPFEAYATEVGIVLDEIRYVIKHLERWAKPKRARTPLVHFLSSSCIYKEPYGSVLIMAPWNYPFHLMLVPLAGALAGGNCCVVRPSEYSVHTSEITAKIIREVFPEKYVAVAEGGIEINQELLAAKFDYIFFTGSTRVGKIVMEAAARHLTPVTLELGGKSPCIVDETADIKLAAKRIVWGKLMNAGQTCVAPDYLLVHKRVKQELLREMQKYITVFYGEHPLESEELPKIISERHFRRLLGLMESGDLVTGGEYSEDSLKIAPVILDNISWEDTVMQEEIFGPILPVLEFESLQAAVSLIRKRPRPLALYFFSTNRRNQDYVMRTAAFGGGCINDTMIHLANIHLPFGGVGESGMGQYHGKNSYDTFTHQKSITKKANLLDINLRYPPFKNHLKLLRMIMK